MLAEFGQRVNASLEHKNKTRWNWRTYHIRYFTFQSKIISFLMVLSSCLAHVINLATQALISGYSPTKHFDPGQPTDHEPDVNSNQRDPVGLIRAITVKVRVASATSQHMLMMLHRFGHLKSERKSSSPCKASHRRNRRLYCLT